MQQRFTLDEKSFEEFLAAASFFQQVQRQALRGGAGALHGAQPLLVLMETQRAIELGRLDLDSAMERIVGLTPPTVGASGAGVWLFTHNEFVCGASIGISPADERLRLQVLSRLIREFHLESQPEVARLDKVDSGYYPGAIKSMLVTPVYQGPRIAGALAAFSSELSPFTDRDAANLRLLGGLMARALATAAESGLRQSEALEHAALLQLVEQVTPALRELVASAEQNPEIPVVPAPAADLRLGDAARVDQLASEESVIAQTADSAADRELETVRGPAQPAFDSPEMDDISLPFVGVRASLGSDLYEDSDFWSSLREHWENSAIWVRGKAEDISHKFGAARSQISVSTRVLLHKMGKTAAYRPSLPAFPGATLRRRARLAQSSAREAAEGIWKQAKHALEKVPSPSLPRPQFGVAWNELLSSVRGAMRSYISRTTRSLAGKLERAAAYRPSLLSFPGTTLLRNVRLARSSAVRVMEGLWKQVNRTVERVPSTTLPRRELRVLWNELLASVRVSFDKTEIRLRYLRRRITRLAAGIDLARVPEPDVKNHLRRVENAVRGVVDHTSAILQAAGQGRLRLRLSLPSITLSRTAVRKSAPAWAVLAIMISFLTLELGLLRSWTIAATRSDTNSTEADRAAVTNASSTDSSAVHPATQGQSSDKVVNLEGSHLKVTDPATESYLSDMTRFETSALRRRAEFGDEIAAFRLGMAYETGHGLPQNCTKAAQWVMQAAEGGYAAAEFNLGLRYRDGDGVDADLEQANKWLRRAFAHRYSGAEGALLAMTPTRSDSSPR